MQTSLQAHDSLYLKWPQLQQSSAQLAPFIFYSSNMHQDTSLSRQCRQYQDHSIISNPEELIFLVLILSHLHSKKLFLVIKVYFLIHIATFQQLVRASASKHSLPFQILNILSILIMDLILLQQCLWDTLAYFNNLSFNLKMQVNYYYNYFQFPILFLFGKINLMIFRAKFAVSSFYWRIIQFLILLQKFMLQLQGQNLQNTQSLTPSLKASHYYSKHNSTANQTQKDHFATTNLSSNNVLSMTQKQILTHSLINQIMQKSKQNTVQHHINIIPIQTKLFSVPLDHNINQFQFDAIPPTNGNFVSTASQKIKQFNQRLSDNRSLSERLEQLASKNMVKYVQEKRKKSMQDSNVNRRVSISGLVSYDFNSVTSRRTLGCIPDVPEQVALNKQKQKIKRRNSCSVDRQARIIKNKPNIANMKKLDIAKGAICDFHTPTDKFLKHLSQQIQKKDYIYGERMEKLKCMKQYMEKQRVDYDHSKFIVQTIINSQKKQKQQKPQKPKIQIDEELQLSKRRKIVSRKKVMVKHLHFTD